jgi:molecular chaperone GrpE
LPEDERVEGAEEPEPAATELATNPADASGAGLADPHAESPATALADAIAPPPDTGPLEAYEQRARLAEDRLAEVLAAYRKLKVETDGYRERTARNLERRYDQRRERLLLRFIEILDNFDRALEAAERSYAGQPLIEGLILVRTQLLQTLQEEGLERIPVLGLPYDPSVSEAVGTQPVDDPDQHHLVVKELMRGYRLNGRLARPSRAVIGEYREPRAAAAPKIQDEDLAPPLVAPAAPAPVPAAAAPPAATGEPEPVEPEPTLEEIVSRAEAQEALFPEAFDKDEEPEG